VVRRVRIPQISLGLKNQDIATKGYTQYPAQPTTKLKKAAPNPSHDDDHGDDGRRLLMSEIDVSSLVFLNYPSTSIS